jgi:hypothetical protein
VINFEELHAYARTFTCLDNEKIEALHAIQADIAPLLPHVTEQFYAHLLSIPKVQPFLEGRVDSLKQTHLEWMQELFNSHFNVGYTEKMYHVGHVHVRVKLPVEFMAGAMSILQGHLTQTVLKLYSGQPERIPPSLAAINAAIGFSLLVMQESYQASSLAHELEKFLSITGMSRKLFDNLARAYRD